MVHNLWINTKVKKKLVKVTDQEKWTILPTLSPADSMYYSNDNVLTFNNKMKNYVMENFLNAKGDFSKAEKVMEKTHGPKTNREKQKLQRENPINLRNFLVMKNLGRGLMAGGHSRRLLVKSLIGIFMIFATIQQLALAHISMQKHTVWTK